MSTVQEQLFYHRGDDMVTSVRASLGGNSYDLADIDTVSLVPPIINRSYGFVAIGLGLLIAVVGYIVWNGVFLTPMLGGVALIIVGVAILALARGDSIVRLNRRDGQVIALGFPSLAQAQQVASAISAAKAGARQG